MRHRHAQCCLCVLSVAFFVALSEISLSFEFRKFAYVLGTKLLLPGLRVSLTLWLAGGGPRGGGRWWITQVVARSVEKRGCSRTGLDKG